MTDVLASADQQSASPAHIRSHDRVVDLTALPREAPAERASTTASDAPAGEPPTGPERHGPRDAPDSTVPPPPPASPPEEGGRPRRRWRKEARQPKAWSIGPPEHVRARPADDAADRDDARGRQGRGGSLASPDGERRPATSPARRPGPSGRDAGLLRQLFGS